MFMCKIRQFWFIVLINALIYSILFFIFLFFRYLIQVVIVKGRTEPLDGALVNQISGLGHFSYIRRNVQLLFLHSGSWCLAGPLDNLWTKVDGTLEGTFLEDKQPFLLKLLVCLSLDDGGSWRGCKRTWTEWEQLWELNHCGHFVCIALQLAYNVFVLFLISG